MPLYRRATRFRLSQLPVRVTSSCTTVDKNIDQMPGRLRPSEHVIAVKQATASQRSQILLDVSAATVTAERLWLILPVPPSINRQYATVNGRRILSSAGRRYKAHVGQHVWVAMARSPVRAALMDRLHSRPLALSIRFFFTSALRRDVDGGLKITQDALCEGLGLNDNRIIETHLYKDVDSARPRVEVSLAPASPSSQQSALSW